MVSAKWFREETCELTGEQYYKYLGGYWEARASGKWPEDLEDIY